MELQVTVIGCSNLESSGLSHSSNSYVAGRLDKSDAEFRTTTKAHEVNPVWNATFTLGVWESSDVLNIEVFNEVHFLSSPRKAI